VDIFGSAWLKTSPNLIRHHPPVGFLSIRRKTGLPGFQGLFYVSLPIKLEDLRKVNGITQHMRTNKERKDSPLQLIG